jgi:hypothetical protein
MTMETLRGAQERMRRLINRLSQPGKQIDFTISDCDLERLVLDLTEEMKLSSHKKLGVKIAVDGLPRVKGNDEKLKQRRPVRSSPRSEERKKVW